MSILVSPTGKSYYVDQELFEDIADKCEELESALARAEAAEARAAEWCNLAMTIVGELRLDFSPLEKTELDGEAMAHALRREVAKYKRLAAKSQVHAESLAEARNNYADAREAFARGARAMREAVLTHMSYYGSTDATVRRDSQIANAIRTLPLPEMTK